MKKSIVIFGALTTVLLMVSCATARPMVTSEVVMDKIEFNKLETKLSDNYDIGRIGKTILKIFLAIPAFVVGWAIGFIFGRILFFFDAIFSAIGYFFNDLSDYGLETAIKNLIKSIPEFLIIIGFSGIIYGISFVLMASWLVDDLFP